MLTCRLEQKGRAGLEAGRASTAGSADWVRQDKQGGASTMAESESRAGQVAQGRAGQARYGRKKLDSRARQGKQD